MFSQISIKKKKIKVAVSVLNRIFHFRGIRSHSFQKLRNILFILDPAQDPSTKSKFLVLCCRHHQQTRDLECPDLVQGNEYHVGYTVFQAVYFYLERGIKNTPFSCENLKIKFKPSGLGL